ncbi:hypothetical protein MHYP_G00359860 [Metynnis hypsauchen]
MEGSCRKSERAPSGCVNGYGCLISAKNKQKLHIGHVALVLKVTAVVTGSMRVNSLTSVTFGEREGPGMTAVKYQLGLFSGQSVQRRILEEVPVIYHSVTIISQQRLMTLQCKPY